MGDGIPMVNTDNISSTVGDFIADVHKQIDNYLAETGTAPTMFCKAAVNDPNLLRHIRLGRRRLTFNMAVRIKEYLDRQARCGGQ